MKTRIVELFKLTNVTTTNPRKVVYDRVGIKVIEQSKRMIEGLGMDFETNFKVESLGMFKAFDCTYTVNSMSQADIDAGGDNDPFDQVCTTYEKI